MKVAIMMRFNKNKPKSLFEICAIFVALYPFNINAEVYMPFLEPSWVRPIQPFRIAGSIYYVGTEGLAAYLIASDKGAILLDGTLAQNVPQIESNIKALGFDVRDVKILINSHAHYDHAAAFAQLKRDTHARLLISSGDRQAVELGRQDGDMDYGLVTFPPAKVDGVIRDGQTLHLGQIALTAMITPGHTRGCTTWLMQVIEQGRTMRVAFPGSISVAGHVLIGNHGYPGIVQDYRTSFAKLKSVKADIVLPMHPELANVIEHARQSGGKTFEPFVDDKALEKIVNDAQADFEMQLKRQIAIHQN